jgi:hypothetical protein
MHYDPKAFLVDYVIVMGGDLVELQGNVHNFIQAGWLPAGGLVMDNMGNTAHFESNIYQAVYKPQQEEKDEKG